MSLFPRLTALSLGLAALAACGRPAKPVGPPAAQDPAPAPPVAAAPAPTSAPTPPPTVPVLPVQDRSVPPAWEVAQRRAQADATPTLPAPREVVIDSRKTSAPGTPGSSPAWYNPALPPRKQMPTPITRMRRPE